MRISIELKKENKINEILSLLFKYSKLQCDYDSNFTATYVDNKNTRVLEHLSLKQIINYYIEHQANVIRNRSEFELNKSKNRLHILNGLRIAIENIDKSINLIKQSKNKKEANDKLMKELNIDDIQSNSILKLELQRLTGLEIKTIEEEHSKLLIKIKKLKNILENKEELLNIVIKELQEVKEKFGQLRKTEIVYEDNIKTIEPEQEIEEYSTYITLSKQGYFHKLKNKSSNIKLKDGDKIISQMYSSNKSTLLLFSNKGICYKIYQHELDEKKPSQLGEYLPQLLELNKDEKIISMISTLDYKGCILNCYKNGKIAKIDLSAFETKTKRSKVQNAINLESELINQFSLTKDINILCKSSINKILIVNTSQINSKKKKDSAGINVLKSKNDSYMDLCVPCNELDLEQLDVEYYRSKPNAIGNFLKKEHKIIYK